MAASLHKAPGAFGKCRPDTTPAREQGVPLCLLLEPHSSLEKAPHSPPFLVILKRGMEI